MPTSFVNAVPLVINTVLRLKPESFLDIGVGFGKWGHLFREYSDICHAGDEPARYEKPNWRCRIDGIEGHAPYITPMHKYLYDELMIGNAQDVLPKLLDEGRRYDVIMLGDIIEHFDKDEGMKVLETCMKLANKAVFVSTPRYEMEQGAVFDNELETHRSAWTPEDFASFPGAVVRTVKHELLVAVLLKEGVKVDVGKASIHSVPRGLPRTRAKVARTLSRLVEKLGG